MSKDQHNEVTVKVLTMHDLLGPHGILDGMKVHKAIPLLHDYLTNLITKEGVGTVMSVAQCSLSRRTAHTDGDRGAALTLVWRLKNATMSCSVVFAP